MYCQCFFNERNRMNADPWYGSVNEPIVRGSLDSCFMLVMHVRSKPAEPADFGGIGRQWNVWGASQQSPDATPCGIRRIVRLGSGSGFFSSPHWNKLGRAYTLWASQVRAVSQTSVCPTSISCMVNVGCALPKTTRLSYCPIYILFTAHLSQHM